MRWMWLVAIALGCGGSGSSGFDAVQIDVPPPADAFNGGLIMTPASTDFGARPVAAPPSSRSPRRVLP